MLDDQFDAIKFAALLDQTLAIVQKYPLAEQEDEIVEDIRTGLSSAELEPAFRPTRVKNWISFLQKMTIIIVETQQLHD